MDSVEDMMGNKMNIDLPITRDQKLRRLSTTRKQPAPLQQAREKSPIDKLIKLSPSKYQ